MSEFFQDGPQLGNQYDEDLTLRRYLARALPAAELAEVEADLRPFGQRVVTDIAAMGDDAEAHPPVLVPYDPWGRRIDRIDTARGWHELERVAAEEGIVAIAYERRIGVHSRLWQAAKLYLFNASSAIYSCPLAMTDGAARLIEVLGDEQLRGGALRHLTSRDPRQFWTSGQWMTERTGGSDVGQTGTRARREGEGYRLYGTKWFTSATTSQMAMTLARIEAADGTVVEGSRGLSLFYLETRDAQGALNQIEIHRLKDKLGTRALPTAELTLQGTPARLIGEPGRGVRNITNLVNVTRIYNTLCAVSTLRRGVALATDYARRRRAFGKLLADQPLHVETLAGLRVELEGCLLLALRLAELEGRAECNEATADELALLRILTPVAKLYTARQAVAGMSEVLESFGGAGYVEDTGLPRLLRDAQVLSIWEGTTNVLSLDTLRAMARESAFEPLVGDMLRRLSGLRGTPMAPRAAACAQQVESLVRFAEQMTTADAESTEAAARGFAFSIARTYAATLLVDHAQWEANQFHDARGAAIVDRWLQTPGLLRTIDAGHRQLSRALLFDEPIASELVAGGAPPVDVPAENWRRELQAAQRLA